MPDIQPLISQLGLQPHPEGGYYRETYRSSQEVATTAGQRSACTAIYYLLQREDYSAWHRIDSDEMWHFYAGQPLLIHILDPHGTLSTHRLGNLLQHPGCLFQLLVPAGHWFAAELAEEPSDTAAAEGFSLVGCTVAPGFEFSRFELADTQALCEQYPHHAGLLQRLAR